MAFLLLENASRLLEEDGTSRLLLEGSTVVVASMCPDPRAATWSRLASLPDPAEATWYYYTGS